MPVFVVVGADNTVLAFVDAVRPVENGILPADAANGPEEAIAFAVS